MKETPIKAIKFEFPPIYPEEKFLRIFHFDQNEVEIIPKNGM